MRWLLMVLLWPALAFAVLPPPPAILDLTADELSTLSDRDVAIRLEQTDTGGMSIGIIDVAATPSQTMDSILDLPPRVNETGALREVEVYDPAVATGGEPEKLSARFGLRVMGTSIVFYVNYEIDRPGLWAVSTLDETKENDLVSVYASYQVFATGTGSRIIYRSQSDSGRSIPQWISRWLANNALKDQLIGIRARAEGS
ncbi:MAG: hypothetical protein ACJAZO_001859 [Myxococcota bacterium]|jgi:hypothetical protein